MPLCYYKGKSDFFKYLLWNFMDSNDGIKLLMQVLIGILVILFIFAMYLKHKPREVIEGNEAQIEFVN